MEGSYFRVAGLSQNVSPRVFTSLAKRTQDIMLCQFAPTSDDYDFANLEKLTYNGGQGLFVGNRERFVDNLLVKDGERQRLITYGELVNRASSPETNQWLVPAPTNVPELCFQSSCGGTNAVNAGINITIHTLLFCSKRNSASGSTAKTDGLPSTPGWQSMTRMLSARWRPASFSPGSTPPFPT